MASQKAKHTWEQVAALQASRTGESRPTSLPKPATLGGHQSSMGRHVLQMLHRQQGTLLVAPFNQRTCRPRPCHRICNCCAGAGTATRYQGSGGRGLCGCRRSHCCCSHCSSGWTAGLAVSWGGLLGLQTAAQQQQATSSTSLPLSSVCADLSDRLTRKIEIHKDTTSATSSRMLTSDKGCQVP
jgi:hypothetical protein